MRRGRMALQAGLMTLAAGCAAEDGAAPAEITPDGGWYDSLWVAPDGQTALFMYARYDFFPAILEGKAPVLSGPSLPGHHGNDANPWDDSDLYLMTRQPDGSWSVPVNLPVNDGSADCCAMMAGDELFYQKGTDLFIAVHGPDGWSVPEALGLNSAAVDTNPHFDPATGTLYWASERGGNLDLWQAQRTGFNAWTEPAPLPGAVNTPAREDQPFVADGRMRFSRDDEAGNLVAELQDGGWSHGTPEPLGFAGYHAEVSLSADGTTAWFVGADLDRHRLLFLESTRQADGSWGPAEEMVIGE